MTDFKLTPPEPPAKRSVPVCAACGRPLRKRRLDSMISTTGLRLRSPTGTEEVTTADGLPPDRGDYGDNLVCAMRCGYVLAMRLVIAIPGILDQLPPAWRHRKL